MSKKTLDFFQYVLPLLLWVAFIVVLSSTPGPSIPDFEIPNFHLIVHVVEYSILGLLLIRALTHLNPLTEKFKGSILSVLLIMIFAVSDEWHQSFVPGRSCSMITAVQDALYAIIGISFYWLIRHITFRKQGVSNLGK